VTPPPAVDFPSWVPKDWRAAFDPSLLQLWPDPPDPTLPTQWQPGLAARKLRYVAEIGRVGKRPDLSELLALCSVKLVPLRGWKRYVTTCPACGNPGATLLTRTRRPGHGIHPYCQSCRPELPPPLSSLAGYLNVSCQLRPLPVSQPLLSRTAAVLAASLTTPGALTPLLDLLSSPALHALDSARLAPVRRHSHLPWHLANSPTLGWRQGRRAHPTARRSQLRSEQLLAVARGLHPVQFFLRNATDLRSATDSCSGLAHGRDSD
jgi:hypothetical protein